MKENAGSTTSGKATISSLVLTSVFSVLALIVTFVISNLNLAFETKTAIFLTLVAAYLLFCAALFLVQREKLAGSEPEKPAAVFNEEIEGKLFALEEANEFFGASLKAADMFRLVSSRIGEIVPFAACVLFLYDEEDESLKVKFAAGENSECFTEFTTPVSGSLAAKVFLAGRPEFDSLQLDRTVFPADTIQKFKSAIAAPLSRENEVFGVLALYSNMKKAYDENSLLLVQAIGARVAPLFLSSLSFEQSLSNALTDALTNLPNERAFFLILENQLAEAQRYRDERPLTVLAIDVADFAELNDKYGHIAGDRLLAFAANTIKKQLRAMDVLTRSAGDEFLAILPTANEKIGQDVIERIKEAFAQTAFETTADEKIHLQMNFGAATFWRDGETAAELLRTALQRKRLDKSSDDGKVLWFPKEFVN